jgi:hypothetical protein
MQKADKPQPRPRPGATAAECCTELTCESGLRNNYFEGKRLTPDMFRVEQQYLNERRRLLNRAIHGYGVVYGYAIDLRYGKAGRKEQASTLVQINGGLALDRCGRELLHLEGEVAMNDLIAIDDHGRRTDLETLFMPPKASGSGQTTAQEEKKKVCWVLSAHYAEQRTGTVTVKDPCSCDRDEWDHVCETVRFSLRQVPCDECCAGCDCELSCGCADGGCCCDEPGHHDRSEHRHAQSEGKDDDRHEPHPPFRRGGCSCLCDHLTELKLPDCDGRLCEIDEPCTRVWVDLKHGVPLACLDIEPDNCGGWTIGTVDACGPRRLVKRNDLLFDLIRGCDLTYISDFGWKEWHREPKIIDFDPFANGIGPDNQTQEEYVTKKFWVRFSRPVKPDTLTADCFSFTVLSLAGEGRWLTVQRVPITRVEYIPAEGKDPKDHVRGAYLVVDGGWVEDALWGRGHVFVPDPEHRLPVSIEIEVRGDYILDCNGQPVDANAVGRARTRTGNGTPGGTFLSTFQVGPRPKPVYGKPGQTDKQDPAKGAAS